MLEIEQYKPCLLGLAYRKKYASFKEAWEQCSRGDWMLWIAAKIAIDIKLLTLAKGYSAKTVYHLMTDDKSKNAVIAAINFGRGLITLAELKESADAAADVAADVAYAAAAAAAADAAADVAADANAAAAAADANAADANAAAAAKTKNQKKTADICRKYLTKAVFAALNIT